MAFQGVGFRFPGAAAPLLRGFELDLQAGAITALVGPSGCGKSTLLRLAAGLLQPDAGGIVGVGRGQEGRAAFVFQAPTLLAWRTVADNVGLPLELAGAPRARREALAAEALAELGLAEAGGMLPHELSGGMRMRASLARAFVQQPRIMFLDEAFSALDALTRHAAWERFLERWRRTRPTVLLVTHDMDEAVLLADQVVVLGGTPLEVRARVLVDLPRPRRASHRHDPHLGHLVTQVEGWLS